VITERLADDAVPRNLATAQLALTLTFKDFDRVEKIATIPRPLSTNHASAGADSDIDDIGYRLGIVRLGRFDTPRSG
jgi:hypothetical protein